MARTTNPDGVAGRLRLPRLAPQTTLLAGSVLALLCIVGALLLALRQPGPGIDWTADGTAPGLRVTQVHVAMSGRELAPGDQVLALSAPGLPPVPLDALAILDEPDVHRDYAGYNRFFERQAALHERLQQPEVRLHRADGSVIAWPVRASRKLHELPVAFWLYAFSGATAFLISLGVWAFRRGDPAARLLALTGLGFFGGLLCLAVYGTRELALDPVLFRSLTAANHGFMYLMTGSLLPLFGCFPRRLLGAWFVLLVYGAAVLAWWNETRQLVEVPLHAFYVTTFLVPYALALPLAMLQWRHTRDRPLERAQLKWFLLAILASLAVAIGALIVPAIYQAYPLVSLPAVTLIGLLMFIGLALGILRYRLFNLDRWWFGAWLGVLGMLLVIGLDLLLIRLLSFGAEQALLIAVLLAGWVYFPLRRWLWLRLVRTPEQRLERHLPQLLETLFVAERDRDFAARWENLMSSIFNPLDSHMIRRSVATARIDDDGLVLLGPVPGNGESLRLTGKARGSRLFDAEDRALVQSMLDLAARVRKLQQAHEQAATVERRRIMRDLHDDVGARLLGLVHGAESSEHARQAGAALEALREAVYRLRQQTPVPLEESLADWRAELGERLEPLDAHLDWRQPEQLDGIRLSTRAHVNCASILREAVSNCLKHGQERRIHVRIDADDGELGLRISNDGVLPEQGSDDGQGLHNIRRRAAELGGRVRILCASEPEAPGQVTLDVRIPLSEPVEGV